ncbi:MAG: RHS repeat protein, partial [Spirulinaceae cyanobacterium SM2_1_0]|nr:RHS repeat protein [Spirulinaceae cyanobacterium SM2_1_0]
MPETCDRPTAAVKTIASAEQHTHYRYDAAGRLIEAKDAKGQVTRYEYDKAGRRTAVV